jgi:hypothetical protein
MQHLSHHPSPSNSNALQVCNPPRAATRALPGLKAAKNSELSQQRMDALRSAASKLLGATVAASLLLAAPALAAEPFLKATGGYQLQYQPPRPSHAYPRSPAHMQT